VQHDRETTRASSNDIRVVLADDHQLFRQGLKALLELERGITIVGEASDGLEVQRISLEQNANVVLMDINMPIVDGLSATRELLRANGEIGVIILSMHHEEGHVFQALRAGARGYLLKTSRVSEVAGAVRAVASGLSLLDPTITSFLRNQGEAEPVEIFEGGESCRNYLLSKYQGAHAGATGKETVETYGQINQGVSTRDKVRANKFDILMKASSVKEPDAKRAKLAMDQIEHTRGGSVLTIRNRWNTFMGVPLKDEKSKLKD